eukprot:COSAG06_NODE_8234_length_2229_cov_3.861033_2_plen_42_part_00
MVRKTPFLHTIFLLEIEVLQLKSEIAELEIDQSTKTGSGQT